MSLLHRALLPGEEVVLVTRRHASVLVRPALAAATALAAAAVVGFLASPSVGDDWIDAGAGLVAALFLARFLRRFLGWRAEKVWLTDQRLFKVSGIVIRRATIVPLSRIHDVDYRRGPLGRLLGFGDLLLQRGDAALPPVTIERVPDPDRFYGELADLVMGERPQPRPLVPAWVTMDDQDTGPLPRVIV